MRRRGTAIVALAFATAFAGACTGELIPTEPGGGTTPPPGVDAGGGGGDPLAAKAYYDANVAPLLVLARPLGTCASCHEGTDIVDGPDFLGTVPAENYDMLTSNPRIVSPGVPSASLLVLRGAHTGDAFEPGEVTIVNEWITMLGE